MSLRPLLEHLPLGVIEANAEGKICYANRSSQSIFGRRPRGAIERLMGSELYRSLCEPLFRGESDRILWREVTFSIDSESVGVLSSSFAIAYPEAQRGALLMFLDRSAEMALHEHYQRTLQQQRRQNERLREAIAIKLREHEDDISQFAEVLQVAPAVFGAFATEAESALMLLDKCLDLQAPPIGEVLRGVHTLKGNARSLGLNFIGGRAHAVEQLFRGQEGVTSDPAVRQQLAELVDDLKRALARAQVLRKRLGEVASASPDPQFERVEKLETVLETLRLAMSAVDTNSEAAAHLRDAVRSLQEQARIPMESLFQYLRATAQVSIESCGTECDIRATGGHIAISPTVYRALSVALPHLLRNAIVHGIESPDERTRAGKPAVGTVELEAREEDRQLRIDVRDDGRGFDVERLRPRAEALGIDYDAERLMDVIFHPGFSSAEHVTLESGRGYGTSAAKSAITALGGSIEVRSLELGTEFSIAIPIDG